MFFFFFLFTRASSKSDSVNRLLPLSPFCSPRLLLLLFFLSVSPPLPPSSSPPCTPVLNTGQASHMLAGVSKPADGRLFSFPAGRAVQSARRLRATASPSHSRTRSLARCPHPLSPHAHAPPYLAEFQNTSRHVRVVSVATGQEELLREGGAKGKEREWRLRWEGVHVNKIR